MKQEISLQKESDQQQQLDGNQQKQQKKLEKQSVSNFYTRLLVHRPILVICICCVVFCVSSFLTIHLEWFKKSRDLDRDWDIWDDQKVIHFDSLNTIQELFKRQNSDINEVPLQTEVIEDWDTFVMLECGGDCDNVLTNQGLQALKVVEDEIKSLENYRKFCLKNPQNSEECSELSLLSLTKVIFQPENLLSGLLDIDLQQFIDFFLSNEEYFEDFKFLLGKDFTKEQQKTKYLLSIFRFAAPIKHNNIQYKSRYDRFEEQEAEFSKFTQEVNEIVKKHQEKKGNSDINTLLYSYNLLVQELVKFIDQDTLMVIGSIIFVWVYLAIHQKSLFLSCWSIFSIIMSFPLTMVFFRLVFQVEYFASVHIMVLFIILGIAADDVFVFIDAWNQTEKMAFLRGDLDRRMGVTFRRASRAMLATTSTTSAAFFLTGFSNIMPISSFGIFSSILIPVNFLLVITFYPAILIVYEKYVKRKRFFCFLAGKNKQLRLKTVKIVNSNCQDTQEKVKTESNICTINTESQSSNMATALNLPPITSQGSYNMKEELKEIHEKNGDKLSKIDSFFNNQFNSFTFKYRYIILIISSIWLCFSVFFSVQIEPLSKPDKWVSDSEQIQQIIDILQNEMSTSGNSGYRVKVNLVWGVEGLDKSEVGSWDQQYAGDIVWDEKFSLKEEENQLFLYNTCVDLQKESVVKEGKVRCFMLDFKDFVERNNEQFPVKEEVFSEFLYKFVDSPFGKQHFIDNNIGLIDDELKYISVELISVGKHEDKHENLLELYGKWEKIAQKLNKKAPNGLENAIQTSNTWVFMTSQEAFLDNAIKGIVFSGIACFSVLLLVSQNILLSIYSTISILSILVSVVFIMFLRGWQLGVAESISVMILNGFSVDYVVHLANHYGESWEAKRGERVRESLREIGVSILSGSITTFGSALFLIFSTFTLFKKFSFIILITIAFSVYFSLMFLPAVLHTIGPQGNQGKIQINFSKYISCFSRKKGKNKVCDLEMKQIEVSCQERNEDTQ